MVAGAGHGKSTVLDASLEAGDRVVARLRLGVADASPGYLLNRLLASLRSAMPGLVDELADRVMLASEPVDLTAARRQLVALLDRLLSDPLVIVFDGAEVLADSPDALDIVQDLLEADGRYLRIAIASRRPLPLRLAKLRVTKGLLELSELDLVFNAEEIAAAIQTETGRMATEREVELVASATEGWALGVALAVRADTDASPALSSPRDLYGFLEEEVMGNLEPDFRDALTELSIVDELDATLLAVLGAPSSLGERISALGLPAQRSNGAIRLHPLFREFLRDRLEKEISPERLLELRRSAAEGLEASGRGREAVDHWIAAGAAEAGAAVAREGAVLVRSAPEVVSGWLDRLPESGQDPALATLRGQLALASGQLSEADALLEAAAVAHRKAGNAAGDWSARFQRTLAFYFKGDHEAVGAVADGFDPANPESAHPVALATALYAAGGLAAYCRFDESRDIAELAAGHPAFEVMAPLDAMRQFYVDHPAGRLDVSLARIKRAVEALEPVDPLGQMPYLLVAGARLVEDQGRRNEALEWWRRAATVGEEGGQALIATSARAWLAVGLARLGSPVDAALELALARQVQVAGWRRYDLEAADAAIAAYRGDRELALSAANRAVEMVQGGPPAELVWMATTIAPLLSRVGLDGRALEVVDASLSSIDALSAGADLYWSTRLLVHRAWLRARTGNLRGSDEDLARAFAAGEDMRWIARSDWPQLKPLVWSGLERKSLQPQTTVAVIHSAWPEGEPFADLLAHPVAEVRLAVLPQLATSGDPRTARRVSALASDPSPEVREAAAAMRRQMKLAPPPPLTCRTLGRFELRRSSWVVEPDAWERPAAARLVRFLLVHRDQAMPEEELFEALWPGKDAVSARRALQVALSRARAVLDQPDAQVSHLEVVERTYRLRLFEGDLLDAEQFSDLARKALEETGPARLSLLEMAVRMWTGEPLPEDRYEDWAIPWRRGLIDRYLSVLAELARERVGRDDPIGAIRALERLVALDPLHEDAHRALMSAYARTGRRAEALRQYLECRRSLIEELGIEPSEATSQLQGRILAGAAV